MGMVYSGVEGVIVCWNYRTNGAKTLLKTSMMANNLYSTHFPITFHYITLSKLRNYIVKRSIFLPVSPHNELS